MVDRKELGLSRNDRSFRETQNRLVTGEKQDESCKMPPLTSRKNTNLVNEETMVGVGWGQKTLMPKLYGKDQTLKRMSLKWDNTKQSEQFWHRCLRLGKG